MESNNKSFRLVEMYDSMNQALENAKKVKEQQLELIDVIKKSDKVEKFESFIKELEDQVNNIDSQLKTLEKRMESLKKVNDYEDKEIVEEMIIALGLFEND